MDKTILFGNGINAMAGGWSWDDILKRMANQDQLPDIKSNTLKYEYIVLQMQEKHIVPWVFNGRPFMAGGKFLGRSVSTENHIVKGGLCRELKNQPISPYYAELAKLNAMYYITTNYETLLNEEFEKLGFTRTIPANDKYRLFARDTLTRGTQNVSFWNIHGNWNAPETIMLGIKDYWDYTAEINEHLNEGETENCKSWINLFLNTDVHIVGFGLANEETDLWYILNYRKRMIRQKNCNIKNHIFYYVIDKYANNNKNELLRALDVEVEIIPTQKSDEETNRTLFEVLREKIGMRQI